MIARWRKLSGDDPSTFELIQKIHSLQKRLIQKKEDLVHRDLALQERDKVGIINRIISVRTAAQ